MAQINVESNILNTPFEIAVADYVRYAIRHNQTFSPLKRIPEVMLNRMSQKSFALRGGV